MQSNDYYHEFAHSQFYFLLECQTTVGVLRDPPLNGDTSDNNNNDGGSGDDDDDAMINKRKTEVEEINFNRFFL